MRPAFLTCVLVTALSGCSSISRNQSFDGSDDKAFIVAIADGMRANGSESYRYVFQKVDLEKAVFLPEQFSVFFSEMGPIKGDEFEKPRELKTTLRFGGKLTAPGDYVLISRVDSAAYGYSQHTTVHCFTLGAAVFHIGSAAINALVLDSVKSSAVVTNKATAESQLALVLSGYPGMSAPIQMIPIQGSTTFTTTKGVLGGDICAGQGPVTLLPAQQAAMHSATP